MALCLIHKIYRESHYWSPFCSICNIQDRVIGHDQFVLYTLYKSNNAVSTEVNAATVCVIWGFHDGEYSHCYLVGYGTM